MMVKRVRRYIYLTRHRGHRPRDGKSVGKDPLKRAKTKTHPLKNWKEFLRPEGISFALVASD